MRFVLLDSSGELVTVGTIEEINEFWSEFSDDYGGDDALENMKMFILGEDPVSFEYNEDIIIIDSDESDFVLFDADDVAIHVGDVDFIKRLYKKQYDDYYEDYGDYSFFNVETIYWYAVQASFSVSDGVITIN